MPGFSAHRVRRLGRAIRGLVAPTPLPQHLRSNAAVTLGVVTGVCVVLALIGWITRDNPAKLFGEGKPGTLLSVGLLGTAAVRAWLLADRLKPHRFARFWRTLGVCLAIAALDDMFKIHEGLDEHLLEAAGEDPDGPLDWLDGALVLLYMAPVGIAGLLAAEPLLRLVWSMRAFAFAAAMFFGMTIADLSDDFFLEEDRYEVIVETLEESFKVIAGAALLLAVAAAWHDPLVKRLARDRGQEDAA